MRSWSTGSRPSASRRSPSTSPIAISRRRGGSSSSPTRRATCSTRATWRPARRIATSPCCWSMRASGVLTQTRRHACILSLLGIGSIALAVNKMDLVDFDQARFEAIAEEFAGFAAELGFELVTAIPVSALKGDNVIAPSAHMHWYHGPTLLGHLETVDVSRGEGRAAVPLSGAMGEPAASRFSRLCRDGGQRQDRPRRGGGDPSVGQARACGADRHRRRRSRGGARRRCGDA